MGETGGQDYEAQYGDIDRTSGAILRHGKMGEFLRSLGKQHGTQPEAFKEAGKRWQFHFAIPPSLKETIRKEGLPLWGVPEPIRKAFILIKNLSLRKAPAVFSPHGASRSPVAQVSWESAPGVRTPTLARFHEVANDADKQYYHEAMSKMLFPGHRDLVAEAMGLPVVGQLRAWGAYEGNVNPGTQISVELPNPQGRIDPHTHKQISAYASALGHLTNQDAMAWHRPYFDGNPADENGVSVDIGRPFSKEETLSIYAATQKLTGHSGFPPIASPEGARFLSFEGDNKAFQDMVHQAVNHVFLDHPGIHPTLKYFESEGDYIDHDWSKGEDNNEGYHSRLREAGRSDLYRNLERQLRQRIAGVKRSAGSLYGWSPRFDVEDEEGVTSRDPSTARKEHLIDHYSPHSNLSVIDPAFMGSAHAGAERAREDRIPRSYAYSGGTIPEPMFLNDNITQYRMRVPLALYDTNKDTAGYSKRLEALGMRRGTPDHTTAKEKMIAAGGWDGTLNPDRPDTVQILRPIRVNGDGTGSLLTPQGEEIPFEGETGKKSKKEPVTKAFVLVKASSSGNEWVRGVRENRVYLTSDGMDKLSPFMDNRASSEVTRGIQVKPGIMPSLVRSLTQGANDGIHHSESPNGRRVNVMRLNGNKLSHREFGSSEEAHEWKSRDIASHPHALRAIIDALHQGGLAGGSVHILNARPQAMQRPVEVAKTAWHEGIHDAVDSNAPVDRHSLYPDAEALRAHPLFAKAEDALKKQNYGGSASAIAHELLPVIGAGQHQRLGLNDEEALSLVAHLMKLGVETHGENFHEVVQSFRPSVRRKYNARTDQSNTEKGVHARGRVAESLRTRPSLSARRGGRHESEMGGASQGSPLSPERVTKAFVLVKADSLAKHPAIWDIGMSAENRAATTPKAELEGHMARIRKLRPMYSRMEAHSTVDYLDRLHKHYEDALNSIPPAKLRVEDDDTLASKAFVLAKAGGSSDRDAAQTWHESAKSHFGTTEHPSEGGWVLPDGSMLDFSGRHDGMKGVAGHRNIGHDEVGCTRSEKKSERQEHRADFLKSGAVRWDRSSIAEEATGSPTVVINFAHPMTSEQRATIHRHTPVLGDIHIEGSRDPSKPSRATDYYHSALNSGRDEVHSLLDNAHKRMAFAISKAFVLIKAAAKSVHALQVVPEGVDAHYTDHLPMLSEGAVDHLASTWDASTTGISNSEYNTDTKASAILRHAMANHTDIPADAAYNGRYLRQQIRFSDPAEGGVRAASNPPHREPVTAAVLDTAYKASPAFAKWADARGEQGLAGKELPGRMDSDSGLLELAHLGSEAKGWYKSVRDAVTAHHPDPHVQQQLLGLFGALGQKTRVIDNYGFLHRAWGRFVNGLLPDSSTTDTLTKAGVLKSFGAKGVESDNLMAALTRKPFMTAKLMDYAMAIMGDKRAVPADDFMLRAVLGQTTTGQGENAAANERERDYISGRVNHIADLMGIHPAEAQAMIWVGYKRAVSQHLERAANIVENDPHAKDGKALAARIRNFGVAVSNEGNIGEIMKKFGVSDEHGQIKGMMPIPGQDLVGKHVGTLRQMADNGDIARSYYSPLSIDRGADKVHGVIKELQEAGHPLFQDVETDKAGRLVMAKDAMRQIRDTLRSRGVPTQMPDSPKEFAKVKPETEVQFAATNSGEAQIDVNPEGLNRAFAEKDFLTDMAKLFRIQQEVRSKEYRAREPMAGFHDDFAESLHKIAKKAHERLGGLENVTAKAMSAGVRDTHRDFVYGGTGNGGAMPEADRLRGREGRVAHNLPIGTSGTRPEQLRLRRAGGGGLEDVTAKAMSAGGRDGQRDFVYGGIRNVGAMPTTNTLQGQEGKLRGSLPIGTRGTRPEQLRLRRAGGGELTPLKAFVLIKAGGQDDLQATAAESAPVSDRRGKRSRSAQRAEYRADFDGGNIGERRVDGRGGTWEGANLMQKLTIIAVLSKGFYLIVDDNADPKNLQAKGWTFNMNTGVFYTVQVHSVLKFSPYAEKFTGDPAPILAAFATAEKDDDPE